MHHMMNCCNSYHTNGKITMVTTIITAMAAYSNERVAAIVISVLYRMLTLYEKMEQMELEWRN